MCYTIDQRCWNILCIINEPAVVSLMVSTRRLSSIFCLQTWSWSIVKLITTTKLARQFPISLTIAFFCLIQKPSELLIHFSALRLIHLILLSFLYWNPNYSHEDKIACQFKRRFSEAVHMQANPRLPPPTPGWTPRPHCHVLRLNAPLSLSTIFPLLWWHLYKINWGILRTMWRLRLRYGGWYIYHFHHIGFSLIVSGVFYFLQERQNDFPHMAALVFHYLEMRALMPALHTPWASYVHMVRYLYLLICISKVLLTML
jgi:hypothetical protein